MSLLLRGSIAVVTCGLSLCAVAPTVASARAAAATPIPSGVPTSLQAVQGAPATAHVVSDPTIVPQNPFFAANGRSNLHNDSWMTDAYQISGPLGRASVTLSNQIGPSLCGSIAFDKRGRLVTICPSTAQTPKLRLIDPKTLGVIASTDLPALAPPVGTPTFQNFTGGGYFFVDQKDQVWSATATSHLLVFAQTADGSGFIQKRDYDLTRVLTSQERVSSALLDFQGRLWFVTKKLGRVGILNTKTGAIKSIVLGEEIENSFAIDRDGVYIASDKRMYRFGIDPTGKPRATWSVRYGNSGIKKPGQVDAGTGTTPTLMDNGLVAITDNADPMNVVVYRRAIKLEKGQRRTLCEVPVFTRGASATENSLISAGRSLIVENNYGYSDPLAAGGGDVISVPGFARIDVDETFTACRVVWTNTKERAPSVVPKLSTKNGLIYTYTRDRDPNGAQPWFWTTLDFRTGKTVYKRLAGTGFGFNNNYAGITLGPDGTAYLGSFGGIIALRDGE
ncbi:MAG: hypothetical protein WCK06_03635 [Actinomycetota bacterium]